jgi:RNA polymerase sigma factor (sigma-70 family)
MKLRKSHSIASDSFERLFHEYWAPINRFLTRMVVDPAEAEDLALETFFRLHELRPALNDEFNIRGWLHRVAVNLALHSIRSFKRREQYEINAGVAALEETSQAQPPEIFAETEDRHIVRLALAQMNPRNAQLLTMRYTGLTYKEIAAAFNLSQTSIGPLLLRAERDFEKRFRALMEEKR